MARAVWKRPRSALREFLKMEAAGGLILMACAAAALGVANSPAAPLYASIFAAKLGPLSVLHWINDAFMALFFLLVGLEIKRELTDGHLASWADRTLPVAAAVAGMVVPAGIYLALIGDDAALYRGWAIPAATDIAFAIGVLSLLGSRVPASLKLLLTTIAIVDDMGAVAIIALGYSANLEGLWLLGAGVILAALFAANRAQLTSPWLYFGGFILLWGAVLQSGVHATVAGVLAALTVPVKPTKARPDSDESTLHRMEHLLQKPVAFLIVPLFGFANAGVALTGVGLEDQLPFAIAAGLFLGKQLGIFVAIWLVVRLGLAARPAHASWPQIYGMALLCGIGFTMSLFIGDLAFADPAHDSGVKIGVLMGSLASAVAGWAVLRWARPKKEAA